MFAMVITVNILKWWNNKLFIELIFIIKVCFMSNKYCFSLNSNWNIVRLKLSYINVIFVFFVFKTSGRDPMRISNCSVLSNLTYIHYIFVYLLNRRVKMLKKNFSALNARLIIQVYVSIYMMLNIIEIVLNSFFPSNWNYNKYRILFLVSFAIMIKIHSFITTFTE